jgi:predicted phage tail protein
MLVRELAGLLVIMLGVTLVVAALIASGWWSLAFLGGSMLVCGGVAMVLRRVPEQDDEAGQPPASLS